jgi:hypothetical protein
MTVLMPLMWLMVEMTVPLTGTVVDAGGHPVAGASVWLGGTYGTRQGLALLGTARTDDRGRFRLDRADDDRPADWAWQTRPALWAYKPGLRVGFIEFKGDLPAADEPVRLALGPPASTALRVLLADGRPAAGACVRLVETKLKAPQPPGGLLGRFVATTDADGRVSIDGFRPEDISALYVTALGQIVQALAIDADTGAVRLRPVGRLVVRLVGDDPKALRGWTITAWSRPTEQSYRGPYVTHWIRMTTGDDGRAEFPTIAQGEVLWKIDAPEGSNDLVLKEPTAMIRAGRTEEVEIKVFRGVRVEGMVRDASTGAAIPGIKVDVARREMGSRMVHYVVTDARGRFSKVVPPGLIDFSYSSFDLPKEYYLTPGTQDEISFEVNAGEDRHECKPIPLRRAALVRGKAVDEVEKPVAGVSVEGSLTKGAYESHPHTVRVETDARGEFVLGNIIPESEVKVSASWRSAADSGSVIVSRAGEGEPITLHLRKRPTLALSGRVLGSDGRLLSDAVIRVFLRPNQSSGPGNLFILDAMEEVRTGPDGRFRTPAQLPAGNAYRIEAEAPGYEPGASDWIIAPAAMVPDVKLRRAIVRHAVAGRAVDSAGKPVAGAEVFQSGAGPRKTDADGRFLVPGVPDASTLLFVAKAGYHFLGRRIDPDDWSVEFTLRRLDEPAAAPLRPAAAPVSRDEERAIARSLLAEARKRLGDEQNLPEHKQVRQADALVDPDRVIELIEAQIIKPEAGELADLAVGRSEGDPRGGLDVVDAINKPEEATYVGLSLYDRLGTTVPPAFRRELLDRIARRAGEVEELEPAASRLAMKLRAARPEEPPVDIEEPLDAIRGGITGQVAVTAPMFWWHSLDEDERERASRRAACLRMAAKDLPAARALAAEDRDPMVAALLPAVASRARAVVDPDGARALLRESVERLGDGLLIRPSPAIALARLLPMAIRIDPDRAPDILWLALSRCPTIAGLPEPVEFNPSTLRVYLDMVELACLIARYDRASAEVILAPVVDRLAGLKDEQWGIQNECPALFRAVGAFDARVGRRLVDALPEDPLPKAATSNFRFRRQFQVRIALARVLGLAPALRLREPFLPDEAHWLDVLED